MKPIVFAYILGGMNRGAVLCQLTTVSMKMYIMVAKYNFTLNIDIISLLSVASFIGSIIGMLLQPNFLKWFGFYVSLRIVAVLNLIANGLCMLEIHWGYLFALKIFAGFTSVMQVTLVPAMGGELLEPKIRGIVGSLTNLSLQLSMVICNVIQYFVQQNPKLYPVTLVYPSAISIAMIILCFIMKAPKVKDDVEMRSTISVEQDLKPVVKSESIFQMKYFKSFIIAITMGMSVGASGINPVLQYSTLIFATTFKSKKSGTIGAIITSCISLASSAITMPFVKRFKRKQLFNTGLGVMLLCYVALIIILYSKLDNKTLSDDLVLCITSLMIFSFNISSASLFYIIIGEVFPRQVKTAAISFSMAASVGSLIIQTYVYPHLNQQENYIFFLCWMFVFYIFVVFAVPKTANKSLEEIELEMIPKKYQIANQTKEEKEVEARETQYAVTE
ncbi:Sugar_(And other) transporter family protein [Hexamita inflata]|uniref:Sugar (And other) transporter family protein n=1 Tax=Hexamita inflata TaxID=28002 RepID=A0AA86PK61_9EUKA|nr:Sugar (And other) transporter family protein [Hexamita inflata]